LTFFSQSIILLSVKNKTQKEVEIVGYKKVDELRDFFDVVNAAMAEEHVVLRYGGPCNEYAQKGNGIIVFYGAPCNHLDAVDFEGKDYIGLKYGAPCKPPYIIVKYGGPCAELKKSKP
jgi:hypothetical protein